MGIYQWHCPPENHAHPLPFPSSAKLSQLDGSPANMVISLAYLSD
jgi:hypothetical protein